MSLTPKLELRQTQQLAMTPRLQQAIRLLQMTNADLQQFIETELARNPFLEAGPATYSPTLTPSILPTSNSAQLSDFVDRAETSFHETTLQANIAQQVGLMRTSPDLKTAALHLAHELDDSGYLTTPLREIAKRIDFPVPTMEKALRLVQTCSPAGVGARSLSECLRLQLLDQNLLDPILDELIDHPQHIARNAVAELAKLTGRSSAEIANKLAIVRGLNPRPGNLTSSTPTFGRSPDVTIAPSDNGGWLVEITAGTIPNLLVNNRYQSELAANGIETPRSMTELANHASWLVRTLDHRAKTVLRVVSCIVRLQDNYFRFGPAHLRPMTMLQVANEISAHESTVSRAIAGKFILSPQGAVELKSLFSAAIAGDAKDTVHAAAAVKHQIGRMIATEQKHDALTDDQLVSALKGHGIVISRRTVAKYRNAMRIPTASRRQYPNTKGELKRHANLSDRPR